MRTAFAILLCVSLFFASLEPVRAQSSTPPPASGQATLYALDSSAFPSMTALLDVYDATGNFVSGLTASTVTLLEDDQSRSLHTLQELQLGAAFVVALNLGPAFILRDANSVSRLDKILQALKDWGAARPAGAADDISLVANGGATASHLTASASFLEALSGFKPDVRALTPTLDTLSHALDVASEPTAQPGMKRAVLFISSLPDQTALPTLQNLSERAAQLQIRVSVWIVASTDFFSTSGATALKDLAIRTGGQYALFSGAEPLPGPETFLSPLRHTYHLTYTSGITKSGSHSLSVQADLNGQKVASDMLIFNMHVELPNPMLVSPPEQIVRQVPNADTTDLAALQPAQQTVEIIIEFPDGHPRPLAQTTLYVDGQVAGENTAEPFNRFTWDISKYTSSSVHSLQVKVVDSLGLSKTSLGVPVTVTVVQPRRGLGAFLARHDLGVMLGAVLLAGAVLGISLTWGRIRRRTGAAGRRSRKDPLTQPVEVEAGKRGLRLRWVGRERASQAFLVRLKDDGQPLTAPPISLPAGETTFGSDPLQAAHVLEDPSVSALHARLTQQHDGTYTLSDEKSAAGTWVNYEQIHAPRRLQHGDVLHFGRLSYRFILRHPPERPKPRVTPKEP